MTIFYFITLILTTLALWLWVFRYPQLKKGKLKKLACYLAIVWVRVPRETRTYMVIIDPDDFASEVERMAEARRLVDDYLSEFDHETMSVEPFVTDSYYIGISRC